MIMILLSAVYSLKRSDGKQMYIQYEVHKVYI